MSAAVEQVSFGRLLEGSEEGLSGAEKVAIFVMSGI
jgi:hypothetical protein